MHRIILMPIDVTKRTLNGKELDEDGLKALSIWLEKINRLNEIERAKQLPKRIKIKQQSLFGIVLDGDHHNYQLTGFVGFSINEKEHCAKLVGYEIFDEFHGNYANEVQARIEADLSEKNVIRIEFNFYEVSTPMYKLFPLIGFEPVMLTMQKNVTPTPIKESTETKEKMRKQ